MFFKKPEKARIIAYDSYPASDVDFEEFSSESYTNNLPNHTIINNHTWEYEKMEDVPSPVGEEWEWIDCYKALYKTYYEKIKYVGPSRKFVYELNKVYALPEGEEEFSKVDYCGNGFHACLTVKDALKWYNYISYVSNYGYTYSVSVKLTVVAKAKLLVNKKDLSNCYGKQNLDNGKIVGKAIVLTGFVSPEEVYSNREQDMYWTSSILNSNACDYLKSACKTKEVSLNTLEKLTKNLNITLFDYKKMLNLVENGKHFDMTYAQCMFDVYIDEDKKVSQCLNMNYGHVLAEEIISHLDYRLAIKLADNDDAYNRSLSVAEKMQILYSHQMLLKK